jgi:hypothetical protein
MSSHKEQHTRTDKLIKAATINERILGRTVIGYLLFSTIVSIFDLGNNTIALTFSDLIAEIIPSINGTAAIATQPDSARLIMAVSWALIVPFSIISIIRIPWEAVDINIFKRPLLTTISLTTVLIFCLLGFRTSIPRETSVHIAGFIYSLINTSTLLVSLWGLVIFMFQWSLIICAVIGFYCYIKQYL